MNRKEMAELVTLGGRSPRWVSKDLGIDIALVHEAVQELREAPKQVSKKRENFTVEPRATLMIEFARMVDADPTQNVSVLADRLMVERNHLAAMARRHGWGWSAPQPPLWNRPVKLHYALIVDMQVRFPKTAIRCMWDELGLSPTLSTMELRRILRSQFGISANRDVFLRELERQGFSRNQNRPVVHKRWSRLSSLEVTHG